MWRSTVLALVIQETRPERSIEEPLSKKCPDSELVLTQPDTLAGLPQREPLAIPWRPYEKGARFFGGKGKGKPGTWPFGILKSSSQISLIKTASSEKSGE